MPSLIPNDIFFQAAQNRGVFMRLTLFILVQAAGLSPPAFSKRTWCLSSLRQLYTRYNFGNILSMHYKISLARILHNLIFYPPPRQKCRAEDPLAQSTPPRRGNPPRRPPGIKGGSGCGFLTLARGCGAYISGFTVFNIACGKTRW